MFKEELKHILDGEEGDLENENENKDDDNEYEGEE